MKKFSLYILIFSLLLLAFFVREKSDINYLHANAVVNYLETRKQDSISVLFLGDSHLAYSIKNKYLPPNYMTVAYPGMGPDRMLYMAYYIIEKHPEINTVVCEGSDHFYNESRYQKSRYFGLWRMVTLKTLSVYTIPSIVSMLELFCPIARPYLNHVFVKRAIAGLGKKPQIDFEQPQNKPFLVSTKQTIKQYSAPIDYKKTAFFIGSLKRKFKRVVFILPPVHSSICHLKNKKTISTNNEILVINDERYFNDTAFLDPEHIKGRFSKKYTAHVIERINAF